MTHPELTTPPTPVQGRDPAHLGVLAVCAWMVRYARRRWRGLGVSVAVAWAGTGLGLLMPWPMKLLVDNVLGGHPLPPAAARWLAALPGGSAREGLLGWCIVATVGLFLLHWAAGLAAALADVAFGQQMVYDLSCDLYAHLQRLSLRFHSRNAVGDSIRRVTADCQCVSTIVKDAMLPSLTAAFALVTMFALMWRMDAALTLLAVAVLPFLALVLRRYAAPLGDLGYAQQEAEARLYELVEQNLSSLPVVQAFGAEARQDARFRGLAADALRTTDAMTRAEVRFKALTGAVVTAGTAGVLWVGANHALDGRLTVGTILVFLSYLASLYGPIEALMYTSTTVQAAAGSARRVIEVFRTDHEVADRPGALALPRARGHLRLERVTFGYDPHRPPVLRDVSLEALPGQTVALVGATGAGKSTLASLAPRFFDPWQGRVTLDGHDLRDLRLKDLRSQVALVLQDSFLFPLTIAENIAYGRPSASREEIEAAARAANADAFIRRLPDGYDTVVGERGATLSGGERQRLSIARALLKDAPVLILDEPTSALDAETEHLLLEALGRLRRGRTTLIIAHRLSTIRDADRIAVVDHGRIAETGTHRELLALGGMYHALHAAHTGTRPEAHDAPRSSVDECQVTGAHR